MNNFMKALGIIILVIGVLILAIPHLTNTATNATLWTGLILILGGFAAHIILNKRNAR
ncbi:Uncharacterised protein [Porphyromonas macacae]|uniref:Uncharacterized protein n=1 Tax=Porphyromonas macacae TaxID=28115 RepID=A0A379E6H8_9PORP|nr:hypothetical protein [Porphyromonas macacae]SUB88030.1 Uncharacterised protein [Porphyromonas macacae]